MAEKLRVPLHVLLTIPWLPSRQLPHPWARAWDANIADWLTAAAGALLAPGLALARAISPAAAASVREALLGRVRAAANWATTPVLDHTAWWAPLLRLGSWACMRLQRCACVHAELCRPGDSAS